MHILINKLCLPQNTSPQRNDNTLSPWMAFQIVRKNDPHKTNYRNIQHSPRAPLSRCCPRFTCVFFRELWTYGAIHNHFSKQRKKTAFALRPTKTIKDVVCWLEIAIGTSFWFWGFVPHSHKVTKKSNKIKIKINYAGAKKGIVRNVALWVRTTRYA